MRVRGRAMLVILSVFAALAVAVGPAFAQQQSSGVVVTATQTAVGKVLFTSGGRALYERSFDGLTPGQSSCGYTNNCAVAWPPLLAPGPNGPFAASEGVDAAHLGTIPRTDAEGNTVHQVTYFGRPLYEFSRDTAAGNINGENVAAFFSIWNLLDIQGRPAAGQASVSLELSSAGPVLDGATAFGGHRSLYLLTADPQKATSCTGPCAAIWPPLITTGRPAAGPGILEEGLGTLRRPDGTFQVTYFGVPLYRFAFDSAPGAPSGLTNGEYFIDPLAFGVWYLMGPSGVASPGSAQIGTEASSTLGTILSIAPATDNGQAYTLYAFTADTATTSACNGACARFWMPVITSTPPTAAAGSGVDATKLGSILRQDGTFQVTYGGHPLYLFSHDQIPPPITTNGQGITAFGGTFNVVGTSGTPIS